MTTVELFTDIGLDMTMKRTMDFVSKTAQDSWFSSKVSKRITDVAFNKLQNVLKLPMDYGTALSYTYVRFIDLDSSSRKYYYFVSSIELIDDSTVAMHLAVDPIQTFMTEWSIGPCMVNRKHCDRWGSGTLPIRDKSNIEGIQATYVGLSSDIIEHTASFKNQYSVTITKRVGAVVFSYTTNNSGFITAFVPVVFNNDYKYNTSHIVISDTTYNIFSIEECYNNTLFTHLGIDPESVVSMVFLPYMPIEGTINKMVASGEFADYTWEFTSLSISDYIINNEYAVIKLQNKEVRYFNINITRPVKPTNNKVYSSTYEPALFKEPYIFRKFISLDGIFNEDIPDIIVNQESSTIYIKTQVAPSQQVMTLSWNDSFDSPAELAKNKGMALVTTVMPAAFDVVTNAWLTYSLTQRDADRAIINNNNMQNAISNLLFMGYGGALVGSRGGGIIKYNPVYDNVSGVPKTQQTILDYRRGINPAIPGAVGLAAGASIVTSLVDAHFAWENQKQQERKIQNKAQQITISGNSAYDNAKDNFDNPIFVELKCDDVNYNQAAANFRYYGYEINEWQVPDIKSRKYYDYIMTNGAIINGSIPQDMKEQIAKVLDSGITFFHSDYSSSTTYNDYENIERALL